MLLQGHSMLGKFVEVNGFTVHYLEIGSGPPVILLHGLGGSLQDWSENIEALSSTHRLYALDLPGFGMSPLPSTPMEYNLGYAAGFLRAFTDQLGLGRVVVIGNSLGGGICLKYAIDCPERTAGLVLSNAVGLGREITWSIRVLSLSGVAKIALRFVTRRMIRRVWESLFFDPTHATEQRVEQTWQWLQKPGVRGFLERVYREGVTICGQKEIILEDITSIEAPTLITWGADDQVLPVLHAHAAHRRMGGLLHVLKECGHIPQIERSGDFNQLACEFLAAINYG